jgi:hypothetical protein
LNILYPPLSAGGTKILAGQPANLYPGYPPCSVEIMKFQQFYYVEKNPTFGWSISNNNCGWASEILHHRW